MIFKISRDKLIILSYFSGIILAGSFLLMLPISWKGEAPLSYIDALFTSTSAVCVTGLITVDTALYTRFGQTIIAALIQFGGLGIITFATIFVTLPKARISLVNRTLIQDYYIGEVEYQPKKIITHILITTFAIESLGALLLYTRFKGLSDGFFVAFFHSISAFCNAGFSTFTPSLEDYVGDAVVSLTICGLIISGGLGFLVFRDMGKRLLGGKRRLTTHTRVVLFMTASLVLVGMGIFFFLEAGHSLKGYPLGTKFLASLFMSVTPRTAGFDTVNPANLSDASTLLTIILMFIGASPGSTGGGVKTTTFFVLILVALKGTDEEGRLNVGTRSIGTASIVKAVGVVGKGLLIIIASTCAILFLEHNRVATGHLGLIKVLYEVTSAFGTVGLSLGITSSLVEASKLVLIFTMFAGRIGLFAMALPGASKRVDRYVSLPEADVMIG